MPALVDIARRKLLTYAGGLAVAAALPMSAVAGATKSAGVQIRRLSWAGILIETDATALFIDAISPDPTKGEPTDVLATSRAPYAVITHHHGDHFDNETVRSILGKSGRLVCLREAVDWADTRGLRVQPVDMWQPVFFPPAGDDLVAFPVPAVDGWGSPQASWVIDDKGIPAVLTSEQAVAATQELRAGMVVPIHFGRADPPGYMETPHPLSDLQIAAAAAHLPVRVLQTGDSLQLQKSTGCP